MPLITGSNALNSTFTPAAGDFTVDVQGGAVNLQRDSGGGFIWVGRIEQGVGMVVSNPVASVNYRFTLAAGNPTVRADQ